ncbi:MAG: exodeoxyribonuclease III [Vicingaceae bacterium]
MKFISWNVNGIRAQLNKGFDKFIVEWDVDVFLFQETKATVEIVKEIGLSFPKYSIYANEAEKKGYSGTAIFTKERPISELYQMEKPEHDGEGRITGLEFEDFYLINVYVPNSGSNLKRLDYRKNWDKDFLNFNQKLSAKKPLIIGGDLNVAHKEIDLARPKQNYNKTAGFTQTEIDGLDAFVASNFIDTFRELHPDKTAYTFWNQRFKARERNVGWRIDYFLLSKQWKENLKSAQILDQVMGSDHCPILLEVDLK